MSKVGRTRFRKGVAKDRIDGKSEIGRNAGGRKEKNIHRSQTILFLQLSKSVGEPMLERFWAA